MTSFKFSKINRLDYLVADASSLEQSTYGVHGQRRPRGPHVTYRKATHEFGITVTALEKASAGQTPMEKYREQFIRDD